ncbi:hypothetical protein JGH11_10335 [Dysgonomonas sp. Marseille-P4677]|uniref:hypothetical protein n=1 Tax=Dysgonomonas sp. Marseille-P4677 TaxID=2364790 RepID=UPI0019141A5C|nr:hypothetical protein [Dysgonomonas sp. Marseille-P4677]MBK5721268.1 hypothetical protein [Dysgonomonas sp. Marseille-P4677]
MNEIDLKQDVEKLLTEIDKTHRYSMSKIYNLSNQVFEKIETPQSCASCLIRQVRELRNWLQSQTEEAKEPLKAKSKPRRKYKNRKTEQ